jgi:hypothetical protein
MALNDKVVKKIFGISTLTEQQLDMLKNHKIILEFALHAFYSPKKNCCETLLHSAFADQVQLYSSKI